MYCSETERNLSNMKQERIPRIIHYCWFGGNSKTKQVEKCINSWRKKCPNYEIVEWNENNFDVTQNAYVKWCYDNRKWAFLSDYARLCIINEQGGIYFDTDVELLKAIDDLLVYEAFFGFENNSAINTGQGFGAIKNHPSLLEMIKQYDDLIPNQDGEFSLITCPELNTNALIPFGLELNGSRQNLNGIEILPADFMNPYNDEIGKLNITNNTISVHWYSKSWLSKKTVLRSKITKPLHRIFGTDCFKWIKK